MKAGELAELLLVNPEAEVTVSVDLPYNLMLDSQFTCEKLFGSEIVEVQWPSTTGFGSDKFTIQFDTGTTG